RGQPRGQHVRPGVKLAIAHLPAVLQKRRAPGMGRGRPAEGAGQVGQGGETLEHGRQSIWAKGRPAGYPQRLLVTETARSKTSWAGMTYPAVKERSSAREPEIGAKVNGTGSFVAGPDRRQRAFFRAPAVAGGRTIARGGEGWAGFAASVIVGGRRLSGRGAAQAAPEGAEEVPHERGGPVLPGGGQQVQPAVARHRPAETPLPRKPRPERAAAPALSGLDGGEAAGVEGGGGDP